MFTGIVEELARVRDVEPNSLRVSWRTVGSDAELGSSIAVNGVCLTVIERDEASLAFDVSPETLSRTTLGSLRPGDAVNLERSATLLSRLGGHLVQGHVDAVALVDGVAANDGAGAVLRIRLPSSLRRYVVEKGSMAIDGVSLTVASIEDDRVAFALIPHTVASTNLGGLAAGDRVNVEVDVIAKHVEKLTEERKR